ILDESISLSPADRLKIGKCNLRLSSDVTSKEATLQEVVYEVLRLTPFYKAFQVTADSSFNIYMQEFWASAYVHNRSIKNKNTKKSKCDVTSSFHQVSPYNFVHEINPFNPRRNKVNWHYARDDPMFTTINVISRNEDTQLYGTILPINSSKTKGSKKKADTDTTTKLKPPTVPKEKKEKTSGKGKQKAKELETIPEAIMTEAEQLKIITKRSRKETHSSHASEETDEDDTFDPIVHTPSRISSSDDEDSDNEVEGMDVEGAKSDDDATYVEDQGNEAVEDTNANLKGRNDVMTDVILPQVQATQEIEDTHVTPNSVNPDGQQLRVLHCLISELELKKILIDKKIKLTTLSTDTYGDTVTIKRPRDGADDDQEPSAGTDRGSKRRRSGKEPASTSAPRETTTTTAGKTTTTGSKTHKQSASQSALVEETMQTTDSLEALHTRSLTQKKGSNLARRQDPRESFDELTDTTFDFSAFVMNRLNVKTLTPELLAGPTFELMKGTCKSLTELEYFCEEVYKATTEKLDWINPEGRQYPHDLRQPLPLFHILQTSCLYRFITLSITTLSTYVVGVSHWGKKRRQFYAFAITRNHTRDSTNRELSRCPKKGGNSRMARTTKQLELDTVRRDDDILYKFKEGDFHRLRIQDIEDMLLLLVQGKVTNLNIEERIAFNVSLRMFTRSVVIQRRVEDLQLGVESYQKKLNLTKPDTYRSNLRRRDAYTPYSRPRGFIYENKRQKKQIDSQLTNYPIQLWYSRCML
ncbi:hypothetical protein Tco_0872270, partial [Tanacetum coccineum]